MPGRGRNRRGGRSSRGGRTRQSSSSEESSDSDPPVSSTRKSHHTRGGEPSTSAHARGRHNNNRPGTRHHSAAQDRRQPAAFPRALSIQSNMNRVNYIHRQNNQFRRKLWQVWEVWARNVGMAAAGGEDTMEWQPEAERIIPMEFRRESQMQRMVKVAYLEGFKEGVQHARERERRPSRPSSIMFGTPPPLDNHSVQYRAAFAGVSRAKLPYEQRLESDRVQQAEGTTNSSLPAAESPTLNPPIPTTM